MSDPERIQLSRAKGWRMPPNTVKVDRRTPWGNPFNLSSSEHCWTALAHGFKANRLGRQAASVAMFHAWVLKGEAVTVSGCGLYFDTPEGQMAASESPAIPTKVPPTVEAIRAALAGKNLACWCKPGEPCHADVLLELANPSNQVKP